MDTYFERAFKLAFICGLHVIVFAMLATSDLRPQLVAAISRLDVRVIEKQSPATAAKLPLLPARQAASPQVRSVSPPALMASAADVHASTQSFTVSPQPPSTIPAEAEKTDAAAQSPAAPKLSVTPPRFDAKYLHNPPPAYPRASRLAGQQGQVTLKVLVSDQGSAVNVQVQRSSGFTRLDDAALDAVRQWRFVPAQRGVEAIGDWVLVPIAFRLDA